MTFPSPPVPDKVLERVDELLAGPMPDWGYRALLNDMAYYAGARGRFCTWCDAHFTAVKPEHRFCCHSCAKSHWQLAQREQRAETNGHSYNPNVTIRKRTAC